MAASLHAARLPPRAWAALVVVVTGVVAVASQGYPEERSILPLAMGRTGANLYHSTMHYLMNQLAPAPRPVNRAAERPVDRSDRWRRPLLKKPPRRPAPLRSVALEHDKCLGAVYQRTGGGSQCVGAVTAALVVGVALLVQAAFYVAVGSVCPGVLSGLAAGRNMTSVVNIAVTNGVTMDTMQGDMTQTQTQDLEQTQDQDLNQDIDQYLDNYPEADVDQSLVQDQMLDQTQTFNGRALAIALAIARAWPDLWHGGGTLAHVWPDLWHGGGTLARAWPFPSLNLCPVLGLYLTR
ncbi:hypothetical protein E2C01_029250 [Portunus trituberculatus]|uniref:Uncharacterized protein n=1 Tax=Portunus trituberculatus TaxID=210409 RepID=A0A5B7ESC1_PORTR|nr:hypothetical protein [Portunus trituberculatus]